MKAGRTRAAAAMFALAALAAATGVQADEAPAGKPIQLALIEGMSGPFADAGAGSSATCASAWSASMRVAASRCATGGIRSNW